MSASDTWDFLLCAAVIINVVQTLPVCPSRRLMYSHFIEDRLGPVMGFGQ